MTLASIHTRTKLTKPWRVVFRNTTSLMNQGVQPLSSNSGSDKYTSPVAMRTFGDGIDCKEEEAGSEVGETSSKASHRREDTAVGVRIDAVLWKDKRTTIAGTVSIDSLCCRFGRVV